MTQKEKIEIENKERADTFGVPLPETCVKLNWQEKSLLFLCKSYYGSFCYHTEKEVELLCDTYGKDYVKIIFRAPQFHELSEYIFEKFGDFELKRENDLLLREKKGSYSFSHKDYYDIGNNPAELLAKFIIHENSKK